MTLAEMRSAVYRRLFDMSQGSSADIFNPTEVKDELNVAAQDVNLKIWMQGMCFAPASKDLVAVLTTPGEPFDLSSVVTDFLAVLLAEQVDGAHANAPATCGFPDGGDFRRANYNREDATASGFTGSRLFIRGQTICFMDTHTIGDTVRLWYAPRPITLSSDTDSLDPIVPIEYHEVVVQKAVLELFGATSQLPAALHAREKLAQLEAQMLATIQNRFRQHPQSRRIRG